MHPHRRSASALGAPLAVRVDRKGTDDDHSLDHFLPKCRDLKMVERVAENRQDADSGRGSPHSSFTAAHRIPANDDDCDDAQLYVPAYVALPFPQLRGDDAASQGSERSCNHVCEGANAPRMQAGQPTRLIASSNSVDITPV